MFPKIGQILHMQVNSIDEEESRQEYKSRISDINDEVIAIEIPIHEHSGRLKRLHIGDELSTFFLTDGGMKNYFTTSVIGFREDVVRLVLLRKPDEASITKVQRRNFLRIPAELEVAVRLSEQVQFVGMTEDVGGGGLSILCDYNVPIHAHDTIEGWLLLSYRGGKVDHVPFKGEVVRAKTLESGRIQIIMQFTEVSDKERQKVIRFCFERQLENRKV